MKLSRFTTTIKLDQKNSMLYNTVSREYYIYEIEKEEQIKLLVQNINSGRYTEDDINLVKELVEKNILISDKKNELLELECKENSVRYQNNVFHIMIIVTNACNFRCTYCVQEHEHKVLDELSEKRIVKLLERMSKQVRKIKISWFGGEPLLRMNQIERIIHIIKDVCEQNLCEIENTMTTNGFLLSPQFVDRLCNLNFRNLQVTVDGNEEAHDSRRFLLTGKGTYETIIRNLNYVLEKGIHIILRINVDRENIETIEAVLQEFPKELRKLIVVSLSNLYQEKDKISLFHVYKRAIELGYQYGGRYNSFTACQVCYKNGMIIDTDAKIIVCANASDVGDIGYIDESGSAHITNGDLYCRLKTVSVLNNPECKNCLELPFCFGTCKYYRSKENTKCTGKRANGLSIEEMAKLDYLYDKMKLEENVCK